MGVNTSNISKSKSAEISINNYDEAINESHNVPYTIHSKTKSYIESCASKIPDPLKCNSLSRKQAFLLHIEKCIDIQLEYSDYSDFVLQEIIKQIPINSSLHSKVYKANVTNIIEYFMVLEKAILGSERIVFDVIVSGKRFDCTTLCRRFSRRSHETILNYGKRISRMASLYDITYYLKYGAHLSERYLEDKKVHIFFRGLTNNKLRIDSKALIYNSFEDLVENTHDLEVNGGTPGYIPNQLVRRTARNVGPVYSTDNKRIVIMTCSLCKKEGHATEQCLLTTTLDLCKSIKCINIR